MEDLSRPPTKIERLLASLLSAVATLIFGAVSVFIFSSVPVSYPALAIFTVLLLVSAVMFCRAAFTVRRRQQRAVSSRLGAGSWWRRLCRTGFAFWLGYTPPIALGLKPPLCRIWACGSSRPRAMMPNISFKADGFAAA